MENVEYLKINLPEDVMKLKCNGNFDEEEKLIKSLMKRDITEVLKKKLCLEKEIIKIIKGEYPYTFEEALKVGKENIEDFTEEELIMLKEDGTADWIFINGEVYFQDSFCGTIIKTREEFAKRAMDKDKINNNEKEYEFLNNIIREIKEKGTKSYFVHLRSKMKIKDDSIKEGKQIKVHIPIPAKSKQLSDIKIINTVPEAKNINDEDYKQRTVYFEENITDNNREFSVEYSYKSTVNYVELKPEEVSDIQPDFEINELPPHIMFTPYIRELCKEIVKDEKNPLIKAKKIYEFVTTKVKYSFVREYFTIENIAEYAGLNLKGDCGVQAILFITLCRCAGIPAKWQSGLFASPLSVGCHDWAQFYIAPYGWLFADPSFGGSAYRKGDKERWKFYFGNIDPFRMVANSEFQYELYPSKKFLRIDPYDNQRGEAEYEHMGLGKEALEVTRETIEFKEL